MIIQKINSFVSSDYLRPTRREPGGKKWLIGSYGSDGIQDRNRK